MDMTPKSSAGSWTLRELMECEDYSRSTLRALMVLQAFPCDGGERQLTAVAGELGLSPSTTHGYVITWVAVGALEQNPTTRRYRRVMAEVVATDGTVPVFGSVVRRGLARELVGMSLPDVSLGGITGRISLPELAQSRSLVVFFFAGLPADGDDELDEDAVRVCEWSAHEATLRAWGYGLVGVSSQTTSRQADFAEREAVACRLLSDVRLELAEQLDLPTSIRDGQRVYEPLTLIAEKGRKARMFYPIDHARDVVNVLKWIEASRS